MDDFERTTTGGDWLSPILGLEDPVGVLSVYVDADPALAAGTPPAWQAPVRAGLRDLVKDARLEWPRAERIAFETRLEELEPELRSLLERRDLSRGRALFAALERGDVRQIAIHAPLPSTVAVDRRALVLPLLAAWQTGRPAGVAELSWARVGLSEWEFGVLRELETIELDVELGGDPGRRATNPAVPQPFPERDRFEAGVGARVLARIREIGAELASVAAQRGWDAVVVDGDARFVDALEKGLGPDMPRLLPSTRPLAGAERSEAAERIGATLRDRREAEQDRLVEQLEASAGATRDAAVVERALAEGRVEHLVLHAAGEPDGFAFREALLRRALETGAEVTVVEATFAALGPDGVAALLRW